MKRTRILAAVSVSAAIALGPASAAVADVGPIDWNGGNRDDSPPVTAKSHPSKPSKPSKPSRPATPSKPHTPRTQITKTPDKTPQTPTAAQAPGKRRQKPAFKVGGPDAIGEAAFYGTGEPALSDGRVEAKGRPALDPARGAVEAKGKPAVDPAQGRVEAKGKTPDSSVTITKQPPRQTVVRVPVKPAPGTPRGGQMPIGAPRTGFGSAAGSGFDPVILATGAATVLGGLTLAGVGVARRRRILA